MKQLFRLQEENVSTKTLILLMSISYVFSVAIRLIWVYQFHNYEPFFWNHQLMINTNDGYYFASWVQDILNGTHQFNPRIEDNPLKYGIVLVTVFAVKIFGLSIDTAILYMPTVISSLVVIPIILIARIYRLSWLGFFAALLGSIAWSYYNRTMTGYYDTDMFSAMAPMFILYFLMRLIEENEMKNIVYAAGMIAIYPFLYDQGQAIVYAMGIIYFAYMIVFHRDDAFTYKSIILISIALMPISLLLKILVFAVIFLIFLKKEFETWILMILAGVSVISFLLFGNVFGLILAKIAGYVVRGTATEGLHFFGVNQTVREAGKIPFSVMANRISGSTLGVIISFIGYILLTVRYKPFILALPLLGIGVFSLWGGLRFTVYAVGIASLGAVYFFYLISNPIQNRKIRYMFISLLTAMMLYPNIVHVINYKVPTVFSAPEVAALENLKKISNPKDYTITWWDYGYPIWYYSNTNTLIDGGKHNNDNFLVSKILTTTSQIQAANLARLSVETYVKKGGVVADELFHNKQKDQLNPKMFLEKLKNKEYKLPKKTRDVYLFLPNRMLNILPTVNVFSNIDLETGQRKKSPFFFVSSNLRQRGDKLFLGRGVSFLIRSGNLMLGKQRVPIKRFIVTKYDKRGRLHRQNQIFDMRSNMNIIYMQDYNTMLVLSDKVYNSLYIQLFVLENYDKNLFEKVISTPLVKIYKVKK